ncbi:MAG: hypothetical protein QOH45_1118, partial [Pseudonocardiales bacterium]|nr:hypothetical protein [Pseudonocardiales bacterium]
MPFRGGGVRPVAWVLLVAALAVGGVAVEVHAHEQPEVAPAADAKAPARASVPLPGSVSLAAIPQPLPEESATGSSSAGELTFTDPPPGADAAPATAAPGPNGVPGVPLAAYRHAEQVLGLSQSACQLHWPVLAAIGRAESDNARGGRVDGTGRTIGQILGPRLDGSPGLGRVPDTDHGQWDSDPLWDRAVGPMQLLPSVWQRYAADGDGDGRTDPNDLFDAALTAGRYLCAGGPNLGDPDQLATALFRYRHSPSYVTAVRTWAAGYAGGAPSVPLLAPAPKPPVVLAAPGAAGPLPGPAPVVRQPARPVSRHRPAPAVRAAPAVRTAPGARSAPGARAASKPRAVPDVRAAPASRPAPAAEENLPGSTQAPTQGTGSGRSAGSPPGTGYVIVIPESAASGSSAAGSPTPATGAQPNAAAPGYTGQPNVSAPGYAAGQNNAGTPGYGGQPNPAGYTGQPNPTGYSSQPNPTGY